MSQKMHRNAGKKWTVSEEQELLSNIQQYRGNVQEISDVHGRSTTAVNIRIAQLIKQLLEQHPKEAVAGMFYKSEKEVDDLLNSVEKASTRQSKPDQMQHVMERLDRMEDMLVKIMKSLRKKKKAK
jgi:hypothetical protein